MSLLEKINAETKDALKAGDAERTGTLRLILAEVHNREIVKHGAGKGDTLTEEEVMEVLRKEVKKRKEAADLYRQGRREDLAAKEEKETAIIQEFLPAAPTEADIRKAVAEVKAKGLTAFPEIMKEAMSRLKGADGSLVAKIIKATESS